MTGKKRRRKRRSPSPSPAPTLTEARDQPTERARPRLLFGSLLRGRAGPSPFPGILSSIGRGLLVVGSSPPLLVGPLVLVLFAWLSLVALGLEGSVARLVDLFAIPPISTQYDLGTAQSIYGLSGGFPIFLLASLAVRAILIAVLTGLVVEAVERGSVTFEGARRGARVFPVVLAVNLFSVGIIITGNLILPVLGPGIGFLGFVATLVAGLFLLVFAPISAVREGRGLRDSLRRSGRAAMLPGGKHLLICTFYFLVALPLMLGLAPQGNVISANPALWTWVYVLACNYVHLAFLAAFAYRWIVAEPEVPEQPVRRRR